MTIKERSSGLVSAPISKRLVGFAALIGLVGYTIIFSELFVRVLAPQPIFPRYVTGMPWGVRGNIPGARYWHSSLDINVEFRINRWGMRDDRDFAMEKPPGTCRIAVFGNSFFMGYEVELRDSFAMKLETLLRASNINVEVLNFSVSGFGTAEMLRTYQEFSRNFSPDLVVFQWHGGDPEDNVRSDLYRLEGGNLVPGAPTFLPSIKVQDILMRSRVYRWIADNSHLYSLLRERMALTAKHLLATVNRIRFGNTTIQSTDDELPEIGDPHSIALSTALLLKSKREIERDGSDFILVDIPYRSPRTGVTSSFDLLPRHLRDDIKVILPAEAFRRADQLLYYKHGQRHLTPYAVEIVARLAAEEISRSVKLSRCVQQ